MTCVYFFYFYYFLVGSSLKCPYARSHETFYVSISRTNYMVLECAWGVPTTSTNSSTGRSESRPFPSTSFTNSTLATLFQRPDHPVPPWYEPSALPVETITHLPRDSGSLKNVTLNLPVVRCNSTTPTPALRAFAGKVIDFTYFNHLRVYTGGTVSRTKQSSTIAHHIPQLKVESDARLDAMLSSATTELWAINQTLKCRASQDP